jgi:hypothetical protein
MIHHHPRKSLIIAFAAIIILSASAGVFAQEKKPKAPRRPSVNSPEVLQDGRVVFRILAPEAISVGLQGTDIPGMLQGGPEFTKDAKDLKLLWFATGSEDRLIQTTRDSVEMQEKNGFSPVFMESGGGHTWINWRNYLNEFAPQLFR